MSWIQQSHVFSLTCKALSFLLMCACSTSIIGPSITKTTPSSSTSGAIQGGSQPSKFTCSADSSQAIFVADSIISITYTCSDTVSDVVATSAPEFLTATFAETTVTFTGTATGDGVTTLWSFNINGQSKTTGATDISTTVVSPSSLTATIGGTFTPNTNNDTDVAFTLDSSLGTYWADYTGNISLEALSLVTDLHGLSLAASCEAISAPYVCHDTSVTATNLELSRPMKTRWKYSAFDQGDYYFAITPRFTISENILDSAVTASKTFTIPVQTDGNITLAHTEADVKGGISKKLHNQQFIYSMAISPLSTPVLPIVGIIYPVDDGNLQSNAQRIAVNRNDDPSDSGSSGVSQSGDLVLTNSKNSRYMHLVSLKDGSWATVGGVQQTNYDLFFNKFSDSSALAVSDPTGIFITSISSGDITSVVVSESFADTDDIERIAVAFVHYDTNGYVNISKINPSGTTKSTLIDDANYNTESGSGTNKFQLDTGVLGSKVDVYGVAHTIESNKHFFYVGYRVDTDIRVTKINGTYDASAGYNSTTGTLASASVSDVSTSTQQSAKMALGKSGSETIIGMVYQKSGGHCFFRRLNQDLTSQSQELDLSSSSCYFPSIHFHTGSQRFIITMLEQDVNNVGGKYEVVSTEITLNSSTTGLDTRSPTVVIRDVTGSDPASPMAKFSTALYEAGDWISIFYRIEGTNDMYLHGYHVSSR